MTKLQVETLEPRNIPSGLVFQLVADTLFADVGDEVRLDVFMRPLVAEEERVSSDVGFMPFSGWVDVHWDDTKFELARAEIDDRYGGNDNWQAQDAAPDSVHDAIAPSVDEIDQFGGIMVEIPNPEETVLTTTKLGSVYLTVTDDSAPGRVGIDDDVPAEYQSLILGVKAEDQPDGTENNRTHVISPGNGVTINPDAGADDQQLPDLHNEDNPPCVDQNGDVSPLDALHVANDLLQHGPRTIEEAVEQDNVPDTLNDVNDDGTLDKDDFDAILVVLNEQGNGPNPV